MTKVKGLYIPEGLNELKKEGEYKLI